MDGRTAAALSCHRIIQSWEWGAPCIILSLSPVPTPGRRETCTGYYILHTATPLPFHIRVSAPVRLSHIFFYFYFLLFLFHFFSFFSSFFPFSSFIACSALTFCGNSSDSKSVPAARNGFSLFASAFPFLLCGCDGKKKERRSVGDTTNRERERATQQSILIRGVSDASGETFRFGGRGLRAQ